MLVGFSLVLLLVEATLNAIFAFSKESLSTAIHLLASIAFAINAMAICCLIFLITHYIPRLKSGSTQWSAALFWGLLGIVVSTASAAAVVAFITLVWTAVRMLDVPEWIGGRPTRGIVIAWLTVWGVSTLLQIGAYAFIAWWTKRAIYSRPLTAVNLEFGVRSPKMGQHHIQPRPTSESLGSQDPTLTPPQTPTNGKSSSLKLSPYGGKGGPASSRTRLLHAKSFTRNSAKSSLDYPTSEAGSIDHPFDLWDTSGLTPEARTAVQPTPPGVRPGLETIPGSRPESPARPLDGPFLPDSPHATSSDTATAVDGPNLPSSPKASMSSPPSSPPNFSRPTSTQTSQPIASTAHRDSTVETAPETLIHPLFRSSTPHPAPVATAGTTVTASPLAGQSITPRTLTRMRSASIPYQFSLLKASDVAAAEPESDPSTTDAGSPGPSIIEDQDLPPVLPGFILSAGQRSSFIGYGKRKSVKSRRSSFYSLGSRSSMTVS